MRCAILVAIVMALGGCVHTVKGSKMEIKIKRTPKCQVDVKVDGKVVFEGRAVKPCAKP